MKEEEEEWGGRRRSKVTKEKGVKANKKKKKKEKRKKKQLNFGFEAKLLFLLHFVNFGFFEKKKRKNYERKSSSSNEEKATWRTIQTIHIKNEKENSTQRVGDFEKGGEKRFTKRVGNGERFCG